MGVVFSLPPLPSDPVEAMMVLTANGVYSRIQYRKGGKEGISDRVIEPRQLVDGAYGLMVRAIQLEPEAGIRTFSVHKITSVAADPRRIPADSLRGNNFCTGELVAFSPPAAIQTMAPADAKPNLRLTTAARESIWTSEWFHAYVHHVREALLDSSLDNCEEQSIRGLQLELQLRPEQIRTAHAYILGEELLAASVDGRLDQDEDSRLGFVARALKRVGWAPGT